MIMIIIMIIIALDYGRAAEVTIGRTYEVRVGPRPHYSIYVLYVYYVYIYIYIYIYIYNVYIYIYVNLYRPTPPTLRSRSRDCLGRHRKCTPGTGDVS